VRNLLSTFPEIRLKQRLFFFSFSRLLFHACPALTLPLRMAIVIIRSNLGGAYLRSFLVRWRGVGAKPPSSSESHLQLQEETTHIRRPRDTHTICLHQDTPP